jgi:aminoglycoside 6-adenylyltransferase
MQNAAKAKEAEILHRLVAWGERQPAVRAMLLTSTRAISNEPVDAFSDYDVILLVPNIHPFFEDRTWLDDFGPVLVVYRDPIQPEPGYGLERFAYVTQYANGLKIDFILFPVELMRRIAKAERLPDVLDVGYHVLLDKDGLTTGLQPPTYRAHIPSPPGEEAYRTVVEDFFGDAPYVAKNLWRDELMPAKYSLDEVMKQHYLRQMLEWRIELDHGWSLKPGAHGKRLKQHLPPEIWSELERSYVGAGIEENWDALFRTIALFRQAAVEVADGLGYTYPQDLHDRVIAYLHKVKALDRDAKTLAALA